MMFLDVLMWSRDGIGDTVQVSSCFISRSFTVLHIFYVHVQYGHHLVTGKGVSLALAFHSAGAARGSREFTQRDLFCLSRGLFAERFPYRGTQTENRAEKLQYTRSHHPDSSRQATYYLLLFAII
jgi:hypothetical protein